MPLRKQLSSTAPLRAAATQLFSSPSATAANHSSSLQRSGSIGKSHDSMDASPSPAPPPQPAAPHVSLLNARFHLYVIVLLYHMEICYEYYLFHKVCLPTSFQCHSFILIPFWLQISAAPVVAAVVVEDDPDEARVARGPISKEPPSDWTVDDVLNCEWFFF